MTIRLALAGSYTSKRAEAESERAPLPVPGAAHAIEDVLLGVAITAFALDERIGPDLLFRVARLWVRARVEGRADELMADARLRAALLPDWICRGCGDVNPGTFEMCWNCGIHCPSDAEGLTPESEALMAIEAVVELGFEREQEKGERR